MYSSLIVMLKVGETRVFEFSFFLYIGKGFELKAFFTSNALPQGHH